MMDQSHAVDSKPIAFELCAKEGFRAAAGKAGPVLLEPIMKLEVVTPEEFVGSVIGDLNRRRGLPKGQEGRTGGAVAVQADVPLGSNVWLCNIITLPLPQVARVLLWNFLTLCTSRLKELLMK